MMAGDRRMLNCRIFESAKLANIAHLMSLSQREVSRSQNPGARELVKVRKATAIYFGAAIAVAFLFAPLQSHAQVRFREPKPVAGGMPIELTTQLKEERNGLVLRYKSLVARTEGQRARCNAVPEDDTALVESCNSEATSILDDRSQYSDDVLGFEGRMVIGSLNAAAAKMPDWTEKDRSRLNDALNKLSPATPGTADEIAQTWHDVFLRVDVADFESEASGGDGPGFPGAGQQTTYQDCTIFALSNAIGQPYGVVAARAGELIRGASYRSVAERLNPQRVIEQAGLNGGEVIMLAEAFGQAEVVESSDFHRVLRGGSTIMINVVPPDGQGSHEVVLTKSFQHGGEQWFEMMDSNQGPIRRLYLSQAELTKVLQENGVAYHAESGTVPNAQ